MKLDERLLNLRKQKGLSQEELGKKIKVSKSTISKWERGLSYPDFENLAILSDFFELSLEKLMKDIDVNNIINKKDLDFRYKISIIFKNIINIFIGLGWILLVTLILGIIGSLMEKGIR